MIKYNNYIEWSTSWGSCINFCFTRFWWYWTKIRWKRNRCNNSQSLRIYWFDYALYLPWNSKDLNLGIQKRIQSDLPSRKFKNFFLLKYWAWRHCLWDTKKRRRVEQCTEIIRVCDTSSRLSHEISLIFESSQVYDWVR